MKKIEASIFDLDGTLLDTLTSLWYSASLSLEEAGLKAPPRESFRYFAGDGAGKLVERYLEAIEAPKPGGTCPGGAAGPMDPHDPANFDYFLSSYLHSLSLHADYEVTPYPGIEKLLCILTERGIRKAVFTNKPHEAAVRLIEKHFGDSFDIVLGQDETHPRKPDPAGCFMIAASWGIDPGHILYIGDSDVDMKTGLSAGMVTIGVLWGFRDEAELLSSGAMGIAKEPLDILKFL